MKLMGRMLIYTPIRAIDDLAKKDIISQEAYHLIRKFLELRNKAVHDYQFKIEASQIYEVVELGLRILKILSVKS